MPRGLKLTEAEKKKAKMLNKKGHSFRQIAKKMNRSHMVIRNFLKNPITYGTKKRSGRRTIVSDRDKRNILKKSSNAAISSAQIINDLCLKMSRSTVDRVRQRANLSKYTKKIHSPLLTSQYKAKRLEFGGAKTKY